MRAGRGALAAAGLVLLLLSACGDKGPPNLMNIRPGREGPDEFGILPPKSLTLPESLTDLPEPTPGGTNLTDPTPNEDAIAALGGKPGGGCLGGCWPDQPRGPLWYLARHPPDAGRRRP